MESMLESGDGPLDSNATDDLTCAARSLQDSSNQLPSPDSRPILLLLKVCLIIFYSCIFIAGSVLNILLFYVIVRYKKLHTLTFGISSQIVVLDLVVLFGVEIFRLVTLFSNEWLFGAGMCSFTGIIGGYSGMARSFLMVIFVTDRFLSVFAAYFYPRHDKKIAITLSAIAWVVPLFLQVPILPGLVDCYSFSAPKSQCEFNVLCNPPCRPYANLYIFLILVPATLTPVVLYALLCWKVKTIQRGNVVAATAAAGGDPEAIACRRQQDRKAAVTFFLLFMAAFLLTSPALVVVALAGIAVRAIGPSALPVAFVLVAIFTSVSGLLVVADPIVIMRHSDVKEVLREIKTKLCGRCVSQQNQNQVPGPVTASTSLPSSRAGARQGVNRERKQEEQL